MRMNKFLFYLVFFIVAFIILRISTFGWRIFESHSSKPLKEHQTLENSLKSHVFTLAGKIGDRSVFQYLKLEEAARYIIEQLSFFGYDVQLQEYSVYDRKAKNIIATKVGSTKPDEVIIVGAHYDSCFNPGADDNASAVAGLLELASILYPVQTSRTIKFVAFVNEEPPFFKTENMGSRVYARKAKEKKEDIKGVVILEMIGYYSNEPNSQRYPSFLGLFYPNRANFICIVGNWNSRTLLKKVKHAFESGTEFPMETFIGPGFIAGVDFSDHWSFWKEGWPAVMITDTAFYRNPHYHKESDTPDKLDYKSMSEVVKGLENVLIKLAK